MTKNFQENSPDPVGPDDPIYARLRDASAGLIYVSETDSDVVPFVDGPVDQVDRTSILHMIGGAKDDPVEEFGTDEFFARLTTDRDWFGERERERSARYRRLEEALKHELTGIKVYKVGRIRIEILIAGRDGNGRLAGVRTRSVET